MEPISLAKTLKEREFSPQTVRRMLRKVFEISEQAVQEILSSLGGTKTIEIIKRESMCSTTEAHDFFRKEERTSEEVWAS